MEPTSFIEREYANVRDEIEDINPKQISSFRRLLRDRKTLTFAIFITFALIVPVMVFFFVIHRGDHEEPDTSYTCLVTNAYRVPCGRVNITQNECAAIHCCFESNFTGCYHSIPSRYNYNQCSASNLENCIFHPSNPSTPLNNTSLPEMKLTLMEINSNTLRIILHTPDVPFTNAEIENKNYYIKWESEPLGVEVFRMENNDRLLTTLRGPLIASDGYWEWTFQLTNEKLFGLGEILIEENKTVTKTIYKNRNDHNTLPNFMAQMNGSFHGVVVEHDGPLEVTVLPSRMVVLKSLAGNKIVLNLFLGPTPADVVKQQSLDKQPVLPPYWALGAHICRDGKTTMDDAIKEYKDFIQKDDKIQFASDCIHENLYTMLTEVQEEHELEKLVQELQAKSHFMMSVPPQILKQNVRLYNKAVELNILYKDKRGILNGSYLEEEVVYPDFSQDSINTWLLELNASLPFSRADGFALRDNWPEEESYVFSDDYKFPYLTEALNSSLSRTIPWDAYSGNNITQEQHIVKHNKYGTSQAEAFRKTLDFDFLLTSSYDYGNHEAALVQNIDISWTNLKKAVTTTLYHSIFGNPLISIPVCGSTNKFDKTNEELCIRWYLVAATFPLFRISSEMPRRDPLNLPSGFAREIALNAIERRYMLLPYYYTALSEGVPLARPMFYDFHSDNNTLNLDEQYMLGNALLVAQPVLPGLTKLRVYLPPSIGTWYEFWDGRKYNGTGWTTLNIVENDWIMFAAAGHIIPMRNYKLPKVGSESPDDSFMLTVALNCSSNSCFSEGSMRLDTTSLNFTATEKGLTVKNIYQAGSDLDCSNPNQQKWPHFIENILIFGIKEKVVDADFTIVDLCIETKDEIYIEYFKEVK